MTRVADILGHAVSRLLNASNLATLAVEGGRERHRVQGRLRRPARPAATGAARTSASPRRRPPRRTGCGRRRRSRRCSPRATARSRPPWSGPSPRPSSRRTSTAMGRSLKSAKGVLECLRTHALGLVHGGLAHRRTHRKTDADLLLEDVRHLAQDRRTRPGRWPGGEAVRGRGPGDQAADAAQAADRCRPSRRRQPGPRSRAGRRSARDEKDRLTSRGLVGDRRGTAPASWRRTPATGSPIQWTLEEGPQ